MMVILPWIAFRLWYDLSLVRFYLMSHDNITMVANSFVIQCYSRVDCHSRQRAASKCHFCIHCWSSCHSFVRKLAPSIQYLVSQEQWKIALRHRMSGVPAVKTQARRRWWTKVWWNSCCIECCDDACVVSQQNNRVMVRRVDLKEDLN